MPRPDAARFTVLLAALVVPALPLVGCAPSECSTDVDCPIAWTCSDVGTCKPGPTSSMLWSPSQARADESAVEEPVLITTPVTVDGVAIAGDVGNGRVIGGAATEALGWDDDTNDMTTVTVLRDEPEVTGMVIFTSVGQQLDELELGEHGFGTRDPAPADGRNVAVAVCGGNGGRSFDYDVQVDGGTVTVTEDEEGLRTVAVHAELLLRAPDTGEPTGEVRTTDASFRYRPMR
jgi:hypothetical protein